MKKITLLAFILFALSIPFNTYGFNNNSISVNIRGSNGSFSYSQHSYQTIHHRPVIRHHRHHRGGHGGGRHIRGGRHNVRYSTRGYGFGYRGTHRYTRTVVHHDSSYGGYYGGGCGCGYAIPVHYRHSPAAYRREVYVSERAYRHGREW